jgi:hypothetical protein
MDQICLVVPILPGRTADARGCMPEPETGGQRSEQRTGIVKEAWYLAPTPAETIWRLEQSGRVRYWHLTAGAAPMYPDHVISEGQVMFLDCPAYLDEDGARAMRASRLGGGAVHRQINRRAAGKRQDPVPARPLVQRAHRIPHRARAAARGRRISQPAATSDDSRRSPSLSRTADPATH